MWMMRHYKRFDMPLRGRLGWRLAWISGLAMLAMAPSSGGSFAQGSPVDPVDVVGTVVDARSGEPVGGAFVSVKGVRWGSLTDAEGHFVLRRVQPGDVSLVANQLGYRTLQWKGVVARGDTTVDLKLVPKTELLHGLQVLGRRLAARRKASGVSAEAFDEVALANSTQSNVVAFLNARAGLLQVDCPGALGSEECYWVDGRPVLPIVYIDEVPTVGGWSELQTMWPQDLYLLEVYDHGGEVRAYTKPFMARAARTNFRPTALGF